MRTLAFGLFAGAVLAAGSLPASAQSTVRIEPRPFYGATVTMEEGVRVFRPLPRHDRVIINPGGQTPLSLGFVESKNYSFNHFTGDGRGVEHTGPAYYGGFGNVLPRGRHHGHGKGHGHGHGGPRR